MRGDNSIDEVGGPWVPLSPGQLTARRAAQRRQRRRRRMTTLAMMVVVVVAVVLVGVTSGGGSRTAAGAGRPAVAGQRHGSGAGSAHRARSQVPDSVNDLGVLEHKQVGGVLAYTPYVRLTTRRRRDLALTLDDGPGPYTSKIIDILKRERAVATFFTIGDQARSYPRLVAAVARAGSEVGDHTETHAYLQRVSSTEQASQIEDAAEAIRHAGAPSPSLFRPPYGSFDATTLSILHQQRLLMVLWSVDTSDYARPGTPEIVFTALSAASPGAIILMHDGGGDRAETVAALPAIIRGLRRRHFHLVTVSQLVAADPPPRHQPPPQPLSGIG